MTVQLTGSNSKIIILTKIENECLCKLPVSALRQCVLSHVYKLCSLSHHAVKYYFYIGSDKTPRAHELRRSQRLFGSHVVQLVLYC